METNNFAEMDDAALEASLNEEPIEPEETTADDNTAQPDAEQSSVAEDDGQQEEPDGKETPEGEAGEGDEPKTVDLRALQEERALRKAEREQRLALEAEVARYRQAEAASLAARHDAEIQAKYEQVLIEDGEDAAANYIRSVTQQREVELQQQFQQQQAETLLILSEDMVREVHQDYDVRFNRMREVLGDDAMAQLINRSLKESPRAPAKWLYEQSKANFPTEADRQAVIQAEVQRQLAELQSKNKPPATRGHQGIAHLSSGTLNPGAKKPVHKMSDAELNRSLEE